MSTRQEGVRTEAYIVHDFNEQTMIICQSRAKYASWEVSAGPFEQKVAAKRNLGLVKIGRWA